MRRQLGIGDRFDRGLLAEESDHFARVRDVPLHPERKGFDALENLERACWAYAGAEIAKAFAPRAQEECRDGGLFLEIHSVETRVGLGQLRKFSRGFPVERASVHEHSADRHAVPAEELRGRWLDEVA